MRREIHLRASQQAMNLQGVIDSFHLNLRSLRSIVGIRLLANLRNQDIQISDKTSPGNMNVVTRARPQQNNTPPLPTG